MVPSLQPVSNYKTDAVISYLDEKQRVSRERSQVFVGPKFLQLRVSSLGKIYQTTNTKLGMERNVYTE